ncbi:MAG: prephenate dehydrogenase [Lachnospiraceae bacterium]|nr:prephenate dehydrogenase [Lachnospiraceae bacterium]
MKEFSHIGFVGFGLIGGSIAKNIRKLYPEITITAYYYNKEHINPSLTLAKEDGTIDNIVTSFEDNFPSCDIIFLCAPVLKNISYLPELKKVIKEDCIITDVGSVKGNIHDAILKYQLTKQFIGGHPMAGSEKTGYENATLTLLENAFYILTPTKDTPHNLISVMEKLVADIGAIPITLDANNHDNITAAISHVPHIIAATLVNMVKEHDDEKEHMHALAAGGFKDITRIASSSPVMWENICLTNANSIIRFLEIFNCYVEKVISSIKQQDSTYLLDYFKNAKNYRDAIPNKAIGIIERVYEIYVDVLDRKGTIATVATILASHDINIKNIGIVNNREFSSGALRIEFYDETSSKDAILVLKKYNYTIFS